MAAITLTGPREFRVCFPYNDKDGIISVHVCLGLRGSLGSPILARSSSLLSEAKMVGGVGMEGSIFKDCK